MFPLICNFLNTLTKEIRAFWLFPIYQPCFPYNNFFSDREMSEHEQGILIFIRGYLRTVVYSKFVLLLAREKGQTPHCPHKNERWSPNHNKGKCKCKWTLNPSLATPKQKYWRQFPKPNSRPWLDQVSVGISLKMFHIVTFQLLLILSQSDDILSHIGEP